MSFANSSYGLAFQFPRFYIALCLCAHCVQVPSLDMLLGGSQPPPPNHHQLPPSAVVVGGANPLGSTPSGAMLSPAALMQYHQQLQHMAAQQGLDAGGGGGGTAGGYYMNATPSAVLTAGGGGGGGGGGTPTTSATTGAAGVAAGGGGGGVQATRRGSGAMRPATAPSLPTAYTPGTVASPLAGSGCGPTGAGAGWGPAGAAAGGGNSDAGGGGGGPQMLVPSESGTAITTASGTFAAPGLRGVSRGPLGVSMRPSRATSGIPIPIPSNDRRPPLGPRVVSSSPTRPSFMATSVGAGTGAC
jgi:hypothetical protein